MKTKTKISTNKLVVNSAIAALYFVLTAFVFEPLSFLPVQIRVAEMMLLLLLIDKDYSYGLILGCFIANMFSPLGIYDIIFGTMTTALTCFAMVNTSNMVLKFLWPAIFNGLIVGLELTILFDSLPFILNVIYVALGEILAVFIPGMLFKHKILNLRGSQTFKR